MHIDEHTHLPTLSDESPRGFSKYVIGGTVATIIILTGLGWGAWSYAKKYDGYIAPNVFVGSVDIGRKTPEEARMILQKQTDALLNHGIDVRLNGETKNLTLSTLIGSDLVEYVNFDLDQTLADAEAIRHSENPVANTNEVLYALVRPAHIPMRVKIHASELNQTLHALFIGDEHLATETAFVIKPNGNEWNIEVKPGVSGDQIDNTTFEAALTKSLETLNGDAIDLTKMERKPLITIEIATQEIPVARAILNAAPYHFTYKNNDGTEHSWKMSADTLASLFLPTPNGTVSMDKDLFQKFLEPIEKVVNVPAQNARFEIKNKNAVKFAESKNGITIDMEKLFQDTLTQISQGSTSPIVITTIISKPTVNNADVNNIGINEVLGYGISSYGKSPKNRKINIQNGVNLLNGLLIAPGETFSLLEALKPFSTDNGYLRELVIKGDKIEPDIGGGLCQIGTTTFRAVMHAGLPVITRQNHSLVVSYYNDPSNNNPGTDATIFDPAPDFKFTNNTQHYILFEAENIPSKAQLKFTLWGTSDGRKGSYTPPTVSRWIPYGDEIDQASTDLKPGEEKCQDAHKGADASFTYTIVNPDGTKTEKVFTSHYRPLPKICLVGVVPTSTQNDTSASTDHPLPPSL